MDAFQILMILAGCFDLFLTGRAVKHGWWKIGSNLYSRTEVPAGFWFFTFCGLAAGVLLLLLPMFMF